MIIFNATPLPRQKELPQKLKNTRHKSFASFFFCLVSFQPKAFHRKRHSSFFLALYPVRLAGADIKTTTKMRARDRGEQKTEFPCPYPQESKSNNMASDVLDFSFVCVRTHRHTSTRSDVLFKKKNILFPRPTCRTENLFSGPGQRVEKWA